MRQQEPGRSDPIRPRDWRKILSFEADAASDRLGWVGLEGARCCEAPASELNVPALTHHSLGQFRTPPRIA